MRVAEVRSAHESVRCKDFVMRVVVSYSYPLFVCTQAVTGIAWSHVGDMTPRLCKFMFFTFEYNLHGLQLARGMQILWFSSCAGQLLIYGVHAIWYVKGFEF